MEPVRERGPPPQRSPATFLEDSPLWGIVWVWCSPHTNWEHCWITRVSENLTFCPWKVTSCQKHRGNVTEQHNWRTTSHQNLQNRYCILLPGVFGLIKVGFLIMIEKCNWNERNAIIWTIYCSCVTGSFSQLFIPTEMYILEDWNSSI